MKDSNLYMFNYFVIFIVLGVFVSANLIVGILAKQILSAGNLSDKFRSSNKSTSKLRIIYSNGTNNAAAAQDVSVRKKLQMMLNTFFWN